MTYKCVDEFARPKGHVPFWIIASRRVTPIQVWWTSL